MASNYGLHFGFRRSDESMAIREGRQKVPAAGTFVQGQPVTFDEANPGFVRATAAGDPAITGYTGLLVQEEAWDRSIYQTSILETGDLGLALNSRLCTIWSGNGTKVWFKNTEEVVRADGRTIPAGGVVDFGDPGDLVVGAWLGPVAGGKWGVVGGAGDPAPDDAQLKVTLTNGTDYLEAVLIK